MTDRNRIIEGKKERQRTMDKLSIKSGQAYNYDKEERRLLEQGKSGQRKDSAGT